MTEIVEITASDTHDLRRRVLRLDTPTDLVEWEGDDDPTTFHLGALADGGLIAISTWLRRRYHGLPSEDAFQLRGMATEPTWRGAGVGGRLLLGGLDRCAASGATLVWARARVTALAFYEQHGFEPVGSQYIDPTTRLPHRDIVRSG